MREKVEGTPVGRKTVYYPGGKCPVCKKMVHDTEDQARKKALEFRTQVSRMASVNNGNHRTVAYPCPSGHGWHVGRAKEGKFG